MNKILKAVAISLIDRPKFYHWKYEGYAVDEAGDFNVSLTNNFGKTKVVFILKTSLMEYLYGEIEAMRDDRAKPTAKSPEGKQEPITIGFSKEELMIQAKAFMIERYDAHSEQPTTDEGDMWLLKYGLLVDFCSSQFPE
jgi:hypothetical protein